MVDHFVGKWIPGEFLRNSMFPLDDTIAAIATAPRSAERGIVRLSGPNVTEVVESWFQPAGDFPEPWSQQLRPKVILGRFRLDSTRSMPCDLYLWPNRQSYTRQPSIELHTLGNRSLLDLVLRAVCSTGARLANPGEFTLRAFLSGRLDLTQAEAVLGVIDAEGEGQFETALRQLAGGISRRLDRLRGNLLNLCADIEAGLDFVEEDIAFVSSDEIHRRLESAVSDVKSMQTQMKLRSVDGDLPVVSLIGAPNAGKSSLLNALAGSDSAIVSPLAGTTRDYVSVATRIAGLDCELIDTAGMEEAGVGPEAHAQRMAQSAASRSQLLLFCVDVSQKRTEAELQQVRETPFDMMVGTKNDLKNQSDWQQDYPQIILTSSKTGEGVERLKRCIAAGLVKDASLTGETVGPTAVRCHDSLRSCDNSLQNALQLAATGAGDELVASEMRSALDHLGQVAGAIYTDDILDRVFSRFCIGK